MRRGMARPALVAALSIVLGALLVRSPSVLTVHLQPEQLGHSVRHIARMELDTLLGWRYWLVLGLLGALELRYPARPGEGLSSLGAAQDLVWLLLAPLFVQTLVRFHEGILVAVHQRLLGGATLHLERALGSGGTVVAAIVVYDFFGWLTHVIRHRVPTLWRFHEVHHSQRSMSPLADKRVHFVEAIVIATIALLPMIMLGLAPRTGGAIAAASLFYTAFIHSNIRTDLGPLRRVLVSPQAHRVHHSVHPEHADTNFGVILLVWDRLFGTLAKAEGEYPTTGVSDAWFPIERSARPASLVHTYARQVLHPFGVTPRGAHRRTAIVRGPGRARGRGLRLAETGAVGGRRRSVG